MYYFWKRNFQYSNQMKSVLLAVAAVCTAIAGHAQEKKSLTLEQLAEGMPAGIISPIPAPAGWYDRNNLIVYENREYGLYNIRTGETLPYEMPAPRVQPAILEELGKTVDNPTFSPDSTMIAYTKGNNLYVMDVATGVHRALTTDGSDLILNGWSSWVYYEEILGRATRYKAFWWSPDSRRLAYYRFDDTDVPMFPIYDAKGKHGTLRETRYPKAGDANPKVEIGMVDLATGETVWADFDRDDDQYFGTPFWSAGSDKFMVPWMPRDQNHLVLYEVSPVDGSRKPLYEEFQKTWIDWIDDMVFTDDGFYMTRDFDGWEQIYFQPFDGSHYVKLTEGHNWGTRILKLDEKKGLLFFTSRAEISTRYDVYRLNLKNGNVERVSFGDYNFSNVVISPDNRYYAALISNVSTPTKSVLVKMGRQPQVTVLGDSKGPEYDHYKLSEARMLFIEVDGYTLPASIRLPVDLDTNRKYPVIISMYGGPNSGTVMDRWTNPSPGNQLWANEGVIQISIDHRASGHCGKEGLNHVYRSLGQTELADYIEWVKYLRTLPYVDSCKIGITGFSFGGTMTVLALTDGADYFQYGIAGGGVYDWQLYDTHYTERYMDTPEDNPEGYAFTRVWERADKYRGGKGSMLRITHGTADDNVHMQNTLQLIDALQKADKQFELMVYPGGYHGYRGYQAVHSSNSDLIFWYRYLLDREVPECLLK